MKTKFEGQKCIIEFHNDLGLANYFRKCISHIKNIGIDMSEAIMETSDTKLERSIFMDIYLCPIYEEGEFYINVKNEGSEPIPMFLGEILKHTKTNKLANVKDEWMIGFLNPNCSLTIQNIKTHWGSKYEHAKFQLNIGFVKYEEIGYVFVDYINERGFIEPLKRMEASQFKGAKNIVVGHIKKVKENDKQYVKGLNYFDVECKFINPLVEEIKSFRVEFEALKPQELFNKVILYMNENFDPEVLRNFIYKETGELYCINNGKLNCDEKLIEMAKKKIKEYISFKN